MPSSARGLAPGTMVDSYQVARLVGRGGMGEVYLARDINLGRKVALKLVQPDALGDASSVRLFLNEARITARFSHPHIVTVYGAGEHEGRPYVALEYLDGQTLRERMDEQRMGLREVLRIGLAVAEALQEAHSNNVLHRDLKPENVCIGRDGRLRVMDFGLAKVLVVPEAKADGREADAPPSLLGLANVSVAEGGIVGTPLYMSPEQWKGLPCTAATDLWGLGVMLYELLSGRLPFYEPSNVAQFVKVCSPEPAMPMRVAEPLPPELDEFVRQCLEKSPADRPTAADAERILRSLLMTGTHRLEGEESPFRGLLPFTERHAEAFRGRDNEIGAFIERLRNEPVLPVVGPSGAGKSSFVAAGIIPRLREQGRWVVLRMRPGRQPFENLALRLVRGERDGSTRTTSPVNPWRMGAGSDPPGAEQEVSVQLQLSPNLLSLRLQEIADREDAWVLLFVDQFEELFTLVSDAEVRRRFVVAATGAADDPEARVRVVLTVRDDFLVRMAETPQAREALGHITVLRSPGADALREILEAPIRQAGYRYEDAALIQEMIDAVAGEPACLPLIQVAGSQLWEERDRKAKVLRRSAYEQMGGVEGALARQADGVLEGLTAEQLHVARELFLRLVTPERTRRVVPRGQLVEKLGEDGEEVLRRLVAGRAVLARKGKVGSDGGDVELVHESLVRNWARLARWLEESREEMVFLAEVQQAAELWEKRGRSEEEVWRGPALQEARVKAARIPVLPARVQEFLDAARNRERRNARRRRVLMAVGFTSLVGVSAILAIQTREARVQRNAAEEQRQLADERRRQAEVERADALREGAVAALLREDMVEARAKLRLALESRDSASARTLWEQLQSNPLRAETRLPARAWTATFLPDGKSIAALDIQGAVHVVDVDTNRHRRVSRWNVGHVAEASFSLDGTLLVGTGESGEVRVWNLQRGTVRTLQRPPDRINWFSASPDGRLVASAHGDAPIHLWDGETGKLLRKLDGHDMGAFRVRFSPDGKLLASGGLDTTVRIWDVATGRQKAVFRGHDKLVSCVIFSPDGKRLVSSGWDGNVRIWDLRTGKLVHSLQGHVSSVFRVRFSPDGRLLATVSGDKTVRLWNAQTGDPVRALRGHREQVYDVGFSPDGKTLLSVDGLGAIRFWDLETAVEPVSPGCHQGGLFGVDFSPDGKQIATASRDRTLRLWDTATGNVRMVLEGHDAGVLGVAFSPDGRLLVSGGNDHTVRLWDAARGAPLQVLSGHRDAVVHPTFSPDGKLIASASNDGTARLWDVQTGDKVAVLRGHEAGVNQASFSPDGKTLATGADDGTIRIWDVATGRQQKVLRGHTAAVYGPRFDPSGALLLSGGWDRTTRLWTLKTGEQRVVNRCQGYAFYGSFHPTAPLIGAACADGTAHLVDLRVEGAVVLRGHVGHVTDIRFSPDGKLAVTVGDDATVRLWNVPDGSPGWYGAMVRAERAEALTHRGWTRLGEREALKGDEARWRAAVTKEARQAEEHAASSLVCMLTKDGALEAWDTRRDERLFTKPLADAKDVVATPAGCGALVPGGKAFLIDRQGNARVLRERAHAIAYQGGEVLVAFDGGVAHGQPTDVSLGTFPAEGLATAVGRVDSWIALGRAHGAIELLAVQGGAPASGVSLAGLPASAVTRFAAGPGGTLLAGFANGLVGVWDLNNGALILHLRLHGRVAHLAMTQQKLQALTDLGDFGTIDLGVLQRDYCDLLRSVWRTVPMIWQNGLATRFEPPKDHRCRRGSRQ